MGRWYEGPSLTEQEAELTADSLAEIEAIEEIDEVEAEPIVIPPDSLAGEPAPEDAAPAERDAPADTNAAPPVKFAPAPEPAALDTVPGGGA
jgi:hypothetical protein